MEILCGSNILTVELEGARWYLIQGSHNYVLQYGEVSNAFCIWVQVKDLHHH